MKKILIIVVLGLSVYFPLLFNGFVWDDEVMFQKAASIPETVYFRPVISALYWGIYNIFGSKPFFFHFFQLVFHISTAVLIYYLFKRFFKETIAFILALIFLVHPASVEAVSFISAMQEVGFTLAGLVGLYIVTNVIPTPDRSRGQAPEGIQAKITSLKSNNKLDPLLRGDDNLVKIFLATFLLLIALLMKETAIVFFPLIFCYLFLFKRKNQPVLFNYSILAVTVLMIYFLFRVSGGNLYVQGQGLFPIMRVDLATRLINIPMIILYYLGKFFYPMNLGIAQHWVVRFIDFQNFWLPLVFEILLFSSAIIYFIKIKNKIFLFFFIWFLLGLLPHLQIIPLNMTVAERWLYFPMIGILGMMGAIIDDYSLDPRLHGDDKRRWESKLIFPLLIVIIVFFAIRSFIRVLDWRSGLSLFSRDIRQDSSFDLQNNMGVELFRVGKYQEAKKYFETSVKLAPYWWVNWNNLGAIYEREKNYQKAAKYYKKAIDNGQYYLAYENLAKILVLHENDKKKTDEFLRKSLKLFPENQNLLLLNTYFQEKNKNKTYSFGFVKPH